MGRFQSREYAVGWLAGIIDGEGSVMFHRHAGRWGHTRVVQIANTDEAIIDATREVLDFLGVRYIVERREYANRRWRPLCQLRIYDRASMERLATEIALVSPQKAAALQAIVQSYTQKRFDRDQLHQLYVVERKSQRKIAELLGVKQWHIAYALKKYGLEIDRSERIRRGWTDERRERTAASMRRAWERRRAKTKPE